MGTQHILVSQSQWSLLALTRDASTHIEMVQEMCYAARWSLELGELELWPNYIMRSLISELIYKELTKLVSNIPNDSPCIFGANWKLN